MIWWVSWVWFGGYWWLNAPFWVCSIQSRARLFQSNLSSLRFSPSWGFVTLRVAKKKLKILKKMFRVRTKATRNRNQRWFLWFVSFTTLNVCYSKLQRQIRVGGWVVVVGVRVRLGCGGGVQICRLWVALMVVLGD